MTASQPPISGPRRSATGPQTYATGSPRRAYTPDETEPIMAGYSYVPQDYTSDFNDPFARDPIVPVRPPGDSIDNYKPAHSTGWLIALVVLLVVGIGSVITINNLPAPPVGTPSPTLPSSYSTDNRRDGVAFTDGEVSGYWRITDTEWQAASVVITIEVMVDTGVLYYDFYAYASENLTAQPLEPVLTAPSALQPGWAAPGDTIRGSITFDVSRQPLTLIMAGRAGTQLSALDVAG